NSYADTLWYPWKFCQVPKGYWDTMENQRLFFDWLADELCIMDNTNWFQVKKDAIMSSHGAGLIKHKYGGSLIRALKEIYPDMRLHSSRFDREPSEFWETISNQRIYFDYIAEMMQIKVIEDWYGVQLSNIKEESAIGCIKLYYD